MNEKTIARINDVAIVMIEDKEKLVPIKPICEALGIQYPTQYAKLKEDDFLNSVIALSATSGSDGKQYEMVCLPYEFIFGWLFTINPKNVKEEAKEAVAKYRIECYRVLYRHFAKFTDYLADKQKKLDEILEKEETVRTNFKNAERELKDFRIEKHRVRSFTFDEWENEQKQYNIFTPAEQGVYNEVSE